MDGGEASTSLSTFIEHTENDTTVLIVGEVQARNFGSHSCDTQNRYPVRLHCLKILGHMMQICSA